MWKWQPDMGVLFSDFQVFASKLLDSADEIDHRNAASRSYYAAFHLADTILDRCPDNDHLAMGSHVRVTDRLDMQGSVPARSLIYILKQMKRVRESADYEIEDFFPKKDASAQLSQYDVFAKKIATFGATFSAIVTSPIKPSSSLKK